MARIYLATSWKNEWHEPVLQTLRETGHEVYDFKNPGHGVKGFSWSQMQNEDWTIESFRDAIQSEDRALAGFACDLRGMLWASVCVLLLPCGRSAHLEAGWFAGQGKPLIIAMQPGEGPDLMYLFAQHIVVNSEELVQVLESY